jgi:hypothetical protein
MKMDDNNDMDMVMPDNELALSNTILKINNKKQYIRNTIRKTVGKSHSPEQLQGILRTHIILFRRILLTIP